MATPENKYTIATKGLSEGKHSFLFELDGLLFRAFESADIKDAKVRAVVGMTRSAQRMIIEVELDGAVTVGCDRCLDDLILPVEFGGRLEARQCTAEDPGEGYDGETIRIGGRDGVIDLADYLYESVELALPYRRVHDEGGCDPEMLGRFSVEKE